MAVSGPPESAWFAAGVFTADASGCGQGAVLNVAAGGSVSVNSATNSASPGDWIAIYATGVSEIFTDGAPRLPHRRRQGKEPVPASISTSRAKVSQSGPVGRAWRQVSSVWTKSMSRSPKP
jgi:uncharacterized protein (TIGR03437 family)